MVRIVVLGAAGMLGREVCHAASEAGHYVFPRDRQECDVTSPVDVQRTLADAAADVVINCAGVVPGAGDDMRMIDVNAYGAQVVALRAYVLGYRHVVNVSTDCVFASRWTLRGAEEPGDATSPYGMTKLAGESTLPNVTNVRCSFVGTGKHGLLNDLLRANADGKESYPGWTETRWNGSTATAVARAIVDVAARAPERYVHLAGSQVVSKHELLMMLRDALGLRIRIARVRAPDPPVYRVLYPTFVLPPLADAIAELARGKVKA